MLSNFHLFDLFSQTCTITGTIFTSDSDFLGSFGLFILNQQNSLMETDKKEGVPFFGAVKKKAGFRSGGIYNCKNLKSVWSLDFS